MPSVSKYFLETAVVVSALGISAVQFVRLDAVHAIASLSIFMAAGSRIAPAVLRIQQGAVQIKGSVGAATPTLKLIEDLKSTEVLTATDDLLIKKIDFVPDIKIKDLTYNYEGATTSALSRINIDINPGSFVALVGPSGGGKSTLVDCMLGVLKTSGGKVLISGLSPEDCKKNFPGELAYVPQEIFLTSGSISKNIALGIDFNLVREKDVWAALDSAQLGDFVRNLPDGLNSLVGENGSHLSGGQKQRIGIARALFSKPKLLVLDEATSAMDGQTEFDISTAINSLRGTTTVVMVAHRLSTVQDADLVVYMDNGMVIATGDFESVKSKVPDFEVQARLLGL